MAPHHVTPNEPQRPTTYRLEVDGRLPAMLADELDSFTVQAGPTTTLTGPVSDPAALYGLIARLEALGLTLLSVQTTGGHGVTAPLVQFGGEHDND